MSASHDISRWAHQHQYGTGNSAAEHGTRLVLWITLATMLIEIEDQGCGIDATALPRLAELFGHAESAFTRPHDGLGVGLYLVKRCLEKLNGRLSFQTSRGEGTRVRVVVPDALVEGEDPALPALAAG